MAKVGSHDNSVIFAWALVKLCLLNVRLLVWAGAVPTWLDWSAFDTTA
ncbi:Uncharacterised protein [Mycobacteroides abscessus subsp. abscessus]|nr:Uncharacterised protein [Mycobacteroides abscessus subsp. abscessus]